jgi:hypothetical protein
MQHGAAPCEITGPDRCGRGTDRLPAAQLLSIPLQLQLLLLLKSCESLCAQASLVWGVAAFCRCGALTD